MRRSSLGLSRLLRIWRFVRDPRVGWKPKALVLAAVLYVLDPYDLFPDVLPGLGWLDDAAVAYLVWKFIERIMPKE